MQGCPKVHHSVMVVWLKESFGKLPSTGCPNSPYVKWLICLKIGQMDKSYMDTTWPRLDHPSYIYTPINAQIMRLTRSILTTVIIENIPFSTAHSRQPLCIDNQCHKITQSNAIKVLLRHLKRCYTTKCINNHADSINYRTLYARLF